MFQLPGGATFLQNSYLDWNKDQQSQVDEEGYQCLRNKRQPVSHGKVLGGTSSINLMLYMRGHPHDYDTWAEITQDDAWKHKNILKYFNKMERLTDEKLLNSPDAIYYGKSGPLGISKVYSDASEKYLKIYDEMGYPRGEWNSNGALGFTEQMVSVADGMRQSTANAHLTEAAGRENLHVLKHTTATKIVINEDKVAVGVEYVDQDNNTFTVKANKEVILSAGPINSPHLLLLSGVGPKEHLEEYDIDVVADLPVGKHLINHHGVFLVYAADKLDTTVARPPPNPRDFPAPMVTGLLALDKEQTYPDFMAATVMLDAESLAVAFCSIVFAFDIKTCQTFYDQTNGREVLFGAIVDFNNTDRGEISLKSKNPLDPPNIYIVAYPNEDVYEILLNYVEDFARIVNTTHFKEVGGELVTLPQCQQYDKNTRDYLRCYGRCMSSTYYHYVGTCAMGKVVDSRLRVKGVKGLRVIDSSIMPTISSGTTNAPTVMIGEKGADMIKEDNQ